MINLWGTCMSGNGLVSPDGWMNDENSKNIEPNIFSHIMIYTVLYSLYSVDEKINKNKIQR